jgi:DNA-binding CsgD family transcriptional regulator
LAEPGNFGTVLLERQRELAALRAWARATAAGSGSLVLVEGQAGMGKTSLIRAAEAEARKAGILTLSATALDLERAVPGAVTRKLLAPLLPGSGTKERRQLLRGLQPVLAAVLDDAPLASLADGSTGGGDHLAAVTIALATLFERLVVHAGGERVAVLVDDAHWADAVSLHLLSYVLHERQGLPVALVLALRAEERLPAAVHVLRARADAQVLRPAPLGPDAVVQLAQRWMPAAEARFCEACGRVCAGNPFFLTGMLRAMREEGIAGLASDADRVAEFLPDSVLSAVLVRLARLGDAASQLARAISILSEAPLRQVAALAQLTSADAEEAADTLVAAGLVAGRELITFTYPLVQAAIYRDQQPFARARAHRRAAQIIDADGGWIGSVAAHLQLSRPDGDAWVVQKLREAAARAVAEGDPAAAAALLERALREPPPLQQRAAILLALAGARAEGGVGGAVESAQAAVELIAAPRDRAAALYELATLLLARSDLPGAAACAEQGLREAEQDLREAAGNDTLADGLEGILLTSAVLVPELHNRVKGRIEELRAAALAGSDPGDPVTLAMLALYMLDRGDGRDVIRRLASRALAASESRGMVRAAMTNHIGSALVFVEDLEAADIELTKVIDQALGQGSVLTAAFARSWRAAARLRRGQLAEACVDAELALELRHFGWHLHVGPCSASLIIALLEIGDIPAARAALDCAATITDVPRQPLLLEARARLALATGSPQAAIDDISTADSLLRGTHGIDHPTILPWRSVTASALARLGDSGKALQLALEEAELARRLGVHRAEGIALTTAGAIARGQRGIELLDQAVSTLSGTSAALEATRALLEFGATLRRERQRTAARGPLRRALWQATMLGAAPLAQRARDELQATGAHPRRAAMDGVDSLTPTEKRIAQLAAEGLSNRVIAETLVINRKTVEWHLGRIYSKLGITGRDQLDAADL